MNHGTKARDLARGKWPGILAKLGINADVLDGNNHPCPKDGSGKDRFRFSDQNGSGSYFCHCHDEASSGRAGGLSLLMCCRGWNYHEACTEVEKIVGTVDVAPVRQRSSTEDDARKARILRACRSAGAAVTNYLAARGVRPTAATREARLPYWDTSDRSAPPVNLGTFDAMVCQMVAPDGTPQALHLTYLADGRKADVPVQRKLVGTVAKGSAIRLFHVEGDEMGVSEGVENGLSAASMFNVPVWACHSDGVLANFLAPEGIKTLWIFADGDQHAAGQIAAFKCKAKNFARGVACHVVLPPREPQDWNDVHREQTEKAA